MLNMATFIGRFGNVIAGILLFLVIFCSAVKAEDVQRVAVSRSDVELILLKMPTGGRTYSVWCDLYNMSQRTLTFENKGVTKGFRFRLLDKEGYAIPMQPEWEYKLAISPWARGRSSEISAGDHVYYHLGACRTSPSAILRI